MSSSPNRTSPLPNQNEIDNLVGLGYLITTVAKRPDLTMLELIPFLIEHDTVANKTLSGVLPTSLVKEFGVGGILRQINAVLPRLPRDEIWKPINILYSVVTALAILVVTLRFYVRIKITPKRLRAEDWVCLATLIAIVIWMATMWAQNTYGHTGQHVWVLSLLDIRAWNIYNSITGTIFTACHCMVKMTFLVFYYRLYPNKSYHIAVYVVGAYVIGVTISSIMVFAFQCQPVDFWNHLHDAKCINRKLAWTMQGCWYIIADFLILALPIPVLFGLQLKLREKLLLVGVFSLGSFISIISIIRLLSLREWLSNPDFTYAFGKHVMWASSEIVLSLAVSCAPALKVLLSHKDRSPRMSKFSFDTIGLFKGTSRSRRTNSGNNTIGSPDNSINKRSGSGSSGKKAKTGWWANWTDLRTEDTFADTTKLHTIPGVATESESAEDIEAGDGRREHGAHGRIADLRTLEATHT